MFDWAGTIVDHGSLAPITTLLQLFAKIGVKLSNEDARRPMGLEKRDHLRAILSTPAVAAEWTRVHGRPSTSESVDALFEAFAPMQTLNLSAHSTVIAGALETFAACRKNGLRIGSCTGYSSQMMKELDWMARKQGLGVDALVCPDEVGAGRPKPWMIFENMRRLDVHPPRAVVKVDDTVVGMAEGRNAGVWCVGLSQTGNELGLTASELAEMNPAELQRKTAGAESSLMHAGAHYVIRSVADLPDLLAVIDRRLVDSGL